MIDRFKARPSCPRRILSCPSDHPEWEFLNEGTHREGQLPSTRYSHVPSETTISVHGKEITKISGNASRLLTGRTDNLYVIQDEEELEQAFTNLWTILDGISTGGTLLDFKSMEMGLVVDQPFALFQQLLANKKHPDLRTAPCRYQGQTMSWGSRKKNNLAISVYDKGLKYSSNRRVKTKIPVNTYTRLEIFLSGKKLKEAFGDQALFRHPPYRRVKQIFLERILQFNDPDRIVRKGGDGSIHHLAALMLDLGEQGEAALAQWTAFKNKDYVNKFMKEVKAYRQSPALTLQDLLGDPDLLPGVQIAEREELS